jgi:hypothetical protein
MRNIFMMLTLPCLLIACGGGTAGDPATAAPAGNSSGTGNPANGSTAIPGNGAGAPAGTSTPLVLSGQVTDGPIAGATVCLYADGLPAKDAAGASICSGATDAQGNYRLSMPRDMASGALSLIATKNSDIKLAAMLGTPSQVAAAAAADGTVSSAALAGVRISHFSTADFALADTSRDGTVSKDELAAYVGDYAKVQPVAALVKAVIDFGQGPALIGGQTGDTLALALAAAKGTPIGPSNRVFGEWSADPANAQVIAAVDKDVADSLSASFLNYRLSTTVTGHQIPPTAMSTANGSVASLSCEINTQNEIATVQIALDRVRRIFVLKHDGMNTVGSYDPQTGAVTLAESDPLAVALTSPGGVTYYAEGYFRMTGYVDGTTGNISGTYSELSANTWSIDTTRAECQAKGTISAVKIQAS